MGIAIKETIHPAFGRHETFTIRYGWLKRGFDNSVARPNLFYEDDVHHILGVGKNMAKSIRYWLSATRLMVEETDPSNRRRTLMRPTHFGLALLNGEPTVEDESTYFDGLSNVNDAYQSALGLDPYLEDLGSWWLLHWMTLSPGSFAPVWWSAFHTFSPVVFTTASLLEHVQAQVESTSKWSDPTPPLARTIKKDVLALLRAYAGTSGSRKRDKADDVVDAPMVPMGLIHATGEGFRFVIGAKPGLNPAVTAFACLDFLSRTDATARTSLVSTLATEVGAPGRAFKLTERSLSELLTKAGAEDPDLIQVESVSGADALSVTAQGSLDSVAAELLVRHYDRLGVGGLTPRAVLTLSPESAWTPDE